MRWNAPTWCSSPWGRTMNTDGLGLERIGVELGPRGEILVNEMMETNVPGVYAAGDVVGEPHARARGLGGRSRRGGKRHGR